MSTLDATDIRILKELQSNSNLTTKELAARVSLSPTPVFDRVKRLEKDGYIKKYVAVLDPEKLNKGFCIFCNVKLKQHNCSLGNDFMRDIQDVEEVTECYNISGVKKQYKFVSIMIFRSHCSSLPLRQFLVRKTLSSSQLCLVHCVDSVLWIRVFSSWNRENA